MIRFLSGKLMSIDNDKATILVGGVGYEVLLPVYVMQEVKSNFKLGDDLSLYISYHQTEKQPKPVLVGFTRELDREFFDLLVSVQDMGPYNAARALVLPVSKIARYIEEKDVESLKSLKGIGERKAEKIVATLKGKVAKFALSKDLEVEIVEEDFKKEVQHILVEKLGHKPKEAKRMIDEALKRKPSIKTAEELFEEVYRGQKG